METRGSENDFSEYRVTSDELRARIDLAVSRTVPLLHSHLQLDPRFATS